MKEIKNAGYKKLREYLQASERAYLEALLIRHDWNVLRTAKAEEFDRSWLNRRIKALGMKRAGRGQYASAGRRVDWSVFPL